MADLDNRDLKRRASDVIIFNSNTWELDYRFLTQNNLISITAQPFLSAAEQFPGIENQRHKILRQLLLYTVYNIQYTILIPEKITSTFLLRVAKDDTLHVTVLKWKIYHETDQLIATMFNRYLLVYLAYITACVHYSL